MDELGRGSLGTRSEEARIDYLQDEHPKSWPNAEGRIGALVSGAIDTVGLAFR